MNEMLADECWEWRGGRHTFGHGSKRIKGVMHYTHRLAWAWVNGPIPEGMCVLHHCDNPPCVNPNHLFLGTKADNNHDKMAKGRHRSQSQTHCKRGHELSGDNLLFSCGRRHCRACRRPQQAARARRLRAELRERVLE